MAEVFTLDAVLFGILVFSGILGNILVIYTVRDKAMDARDPLMSCFNYLRVVCIGPYVTLNSSENGKCSMMDGAERCQYFMQHNK